MTFVWIEWRDGYGQALPFAHVRTAYVYMQLQSIIHVDGNKKKNEKSHTEKPHMNCHEWRQRQWCRRQDQQDIFEDIFEAHVIFLHEKEIFQCI